MRSVRLLPSLESFNERGMHWRLCRVRKWSEGNPSAESRKIRTKKRKPIVKGTRRSSGLVFALALGRATLFFGFGGSSILFLFLLAVLKVKLTEFKMDNLLDCDMAHDEEQL